MTVFFAFLHHAAAFALVAGIAVELVLVNGEINPNAFRRLARVDVVVGLSAMLLLLVGLARVFMFEKGAAYYFHSWPFLGKLALFILIALASSYPTVKFIRWSRGAAVDPAALRRVRTILHAELAGVVLILLFAAMMARGVGFFG